MVDNISMRTGDVSGIKNTGDIDGLNTTAAMTKVSGGIGKLENEEAKLTSDIGKKESAIKKEENWLASHKWMKNNSACHGKSKYSQHQTKLSNLRNDLKGMKNDMNDVKSDIGTLKNVMTGLKADLRERAEMLKQALESGDFEAALGMILQDRLDNLDAQLKIKVEGMNDRNQQIQDLTNDLAKYKGKPSDDKNAQEQITKIQGKIDKLNSDSQMDMIKLQSLTNKRNQTFELLSNLTQKFSQSCDKVIGNIR